MDQLFTIRQLQFRLKKIEIPRIQHILSNFHNIFWSENDAKIEF